MIPITVRPLLRTRQTPERATVRVRSYEAEGPIPTNTATISVATSAFVNAVLNLRKDSALHLSGDHAMRGFTRSLAAVDKAIDLA